MYVNNIKGFSLIEILICTVIIGIMAHLIAYSLTSNRAQYRLNGAIQQVSWDLRTARMQAIKRAQNVIVAFMNDHQYVIGPDINNNAILDVDEGEIKDIQKKSRSVSFSEPLPPTLMFFPGGNSNNSTNIVLKSAQNTKNIIVTITGKVKVN